MPVCVYTTSIQCGLCPAGEYKVKFCDGFDLTLAYDDMRPTKVSHDLEALGRGHIASHAPMTFDLHVPYVLKYSRLAPGPRKP